MAEVELSMPHMTARGIASRIEVPWSLVVRRYIQNILFCNTEWIQRKNCGETKKERSKNA